MKPINALLLIAACALSISARGQNGIHCPTADALGSSSLYGSWQAQFDGEPRLARVLFQKDPEQDDTVVGSITRGGVATPALLAGDVQQGSFEMEESDDGVRISATWSGQVVDASCGKEIKGLWTNALTDHTRPFVLRRTGGWQ